MSGPLPINSGQRREKIILVLIAAAMMLLWLGTNGWASVGFETLVRSACIDRGTQVNFDVDLEDCTTCHGRPYTIENEGNPYWDAYHADNWQMLCEAPPAGWPEDEASDPDWENDPIGLPPMHKRPDTK